MTLQGFFDKGELNLPEPKARPKKRAPAKKGKQKVYDCNSCGLWQHCKSPKMAPHGDFLKAGMVWAEAPGRVEDERGIQLVGESGQILRDALDKAGVDLDTDCVKTNSLDCRPPNNRKPTVVELRCCYKRKDQFLKRYRPKAILLLGDKALESFYGCSDERSFMDLPISALRGKAIPDWYLGAWVCHSYHPAYILRGNDDKLHIFEQDVELFAKCLKQGRPKKPFNLVEPVYLTDFQEAIRVLSDFYMGLKGPLVFDYETSSYRYHEGIHKCWLVGFGEPEGPVYVLPIDKTDGKGSLYWSPKQQAAIVEMWREVLRSMKVEKVAQNLKHEELASRYLFGQEVVGWKWDTLVGNRVQDEAHKVNSLKVQAYTQFGYYDYAMPRDYIDADHGKLNRLDELSLKEVGDYCAKDVQFTRELFKRQPAEVEEKGLGKAYELLHDGQRSFADMEMEGIRLDLDVLHDLERKWQRRFDSLLIRNTEGEVAREFRRKKGRDIGFKKQTSREDLKYVLFSILGCEKSNTLDEAYLERYAEEHEFVANEIKLRKLVKRLSYLRGFEKLQVGGYLYPSFWMDTTESYRSSSSDPNFQNIPTRDPEAREMRRCIIARDGHELDEVDYSGMEMCITACWSGDRNLIDFVVKEDVHAYWAERLYLPFFGLKRKGMGKEHWKRYRGGTKNGFVFPNVYGSYWKNTARGMWDGWFTEAERRKSNYDDWMDHVRSCEREFWRMFSGVRKRQNEAVQEYRDTGKMRTIGWGFEMHGYMNRNKIFNGHIQGPAFLCLLWSIAEILKVKRRERWRTKFPGQIHDANFFDRHKREKEHVREVVTDIMTEKIRKEHKWIVVPLSVEWKSGPNWFDMHKEEA